MDEKIFNLLETMYSDLTNRIDNMDRELRDMKSDMATKEDLSKVEQKLVVIKDKMDQNHKALYDGYKLTYEKLEILEEKIKEVDKNVERQDVEIRVIKRVK